jgi:hypothetical protein
MIPLLSVRIDNGRDKFEGIEWGSGEQKRI